MYVIIGYLIYFKYKFRFGRRELLISVLFLSLNFVLCYLFIFFLVFLYDVFRRYFVGGVFFYFLG